MISEVLVYLRRTDSDNYFFCVLDDEENFLLKIGKRKYY